MVKKISKNDNPVVYLDSSVVVALLLNEKGSATLQKQLKRFKYFVSHHILLAEVSAVSKREEVRRSDLSNAISRISLLYPGPEIQPAIESIFDQYYVRGADALHIASAIHLTNTQVTPVVFVTLDKQQLGIAKNLGLVDGLI